MKRFLSAADAARILKVTPAAVRLMHRRGALEAVAETEGGIRLFQRRDVETLAKRRAAAQRERTL